MIKFVILTVSILSAGPLAAQDNNSAYKICSTLPFAEEKIRCMGVVADRFFAENALKICEALPFANEKISCLQAVADRKYPDAATRICSTLPFADDKISCLQNSGQPVETCIGLDEVEYEVYRALRSLRRSKYQTAERGLEDLLTSIEACPSR